MEKGAVSFYPIGMDERLERFLSICGHHVCHRGLHGLFSPENSKKAFEQAIGENRAFECDVHLSLDGRLVVSHDADLSRLCGKNGVIEELSYAQIQSQYRYSDGSSPILLDDLFALNKPLCPMVIELKAYQGNGAKLAQAVADFISSLSKKPEMVFISFDRDALLELKRIGFPYPLGILISDKQFKGFKGEKMFEFDFVDVYVFFALFHRYRKFRKKGGVLFSWTTKGRLSHFVGKNFTDAETWEKVNSAKDKNKENGYLRKLHSKGKI